MINVGVTDVIWPFELTVMAGTCEAFPYDPETFAMSVIKTPLVLAVSPPPARAVTLNTRPALFKPLPAE